MKLEKGKFYRTRSGEKVECLTTEGNGEQPVVVLDRDGDVYYYKLNGKFWRDGAESRRDIISEWSDVVIPWDDYPRWCNWVAMDSLSNWCAFKVKPFMEEENYEDNDNYYTGHGMWDTRDSFMDVPTEYEPKGFKGDWKDSLFERPKKD